MLTALIAMVILAIAIGMTRMKGARAGITFLVSVIAVLSVTAVTLILIGA